MAWSGYRSYVDSVSIAGCRLGRCTPRGGAPKRGRRTPRGRAPKRGRCTLRGRAPKRGHLAADQGGAGEGWLPPIEGAPARGGCRRSRGRRRGVAAADRGGAGEGWLPPIEGVLPPPLLPPIEGAPWRGGTSVGATPARGYRTGVSHPPVPARSVYRDRGVLYHQPTTYLWGVPCNPHL